MSSSRKLVAALACRNNGTRLYGKPMQNLLQGVSIIDQIINSLKQFNQINEIVLGISDGDANLVFREVADKHHIPFLFGDADDVLIRLIQCGELAQATDIFRITTECPWIDYNLIKPMWEQHIVNSNDITVCDRLPEGLNFEIYTLDALKKSHERGESVDRSEYCSNYPRKHPKEFKIEVIHPPKELQRLDLRITVDNPEDLVLCRAIASNFQSEMPLVSTEKIINFLDTRPDLKALVASFVVPEPLWDFLN